MKSLALILVCLLAVPVAPTFAASPTSLPVLAQGSGASNGTGEQPDQDLTVERGASSNSMSTPTSKVTPVKPNFNVQGVIMLFLMAAALFPICKSSHRGR